MKKIIGSAQFGSDYGISNREGIVKKNEIIRLLKLCEEKGITDIDTAPAYGDAENILGECLNNKWKITTKISSLHEKNISFRSWVNESIKASLDKLKRKKITNILFHSAEDFKKFDKAEVNDVLEDLKIRGLVENIGVSVYYPSEIFSLYDFYNFNVFQIPLNYLDKRFLDHKVLLATKARKTKLIARSIFLQGLLLMNRNEQIERFPQYSKIWNENYDWHKLNKTSQIQSCINFIESIKDINGYVIGVQNTKQLDEIVNLSKQSNNIFPKFNLDIDDKLLIPIFW